MPKNISSGGLDAILNTLDHARKKTGLLRSSKALLRMNRHDGFDCPGCAWPEPKNRSRFEFCENGAKTLMNATTTKKVDAQFFMKNSVEDLRKWSDYQLSNCGRLVVPAIKKPDDSHFLPITYAQAFDVASYYFRALENRNKAVFYTSGRASNEAAFLYQLFARAFQTNNLCDCSNLCHESSGVALHKTLGVGKGTVSLEDFLEAELIFLIGHNPSSNHPRMLSTLRDARKKGALIVVINPLVEPGLKKFRHPQKINDLLGKAKEIASHYFQVKVGGDLALFNGIAHALLLDKRYEGALDADFIKSHTLGLEEFIDSLKSLDFKKLVVESGLSTEEIYFLAELIAQKKRVIYAWGMGITQTTYAVATIASITNLALLRGHIGIPGAGLCPVRGHSNVQGNRTVGITEKPSVTFLNRLDEVFGIKAPRCHGLDVVSSIHAMLRNEVEIFMALGGNFLSASPDTNETRRALQNCNLAIHIGISLNRTHLDAGRTSLIIPCLTRVEKDRQQGQEQIVSVENSMGIVHASRGNFEPIDKDLYSEVAIIGSIAKLTLPANPKISWENFINNYDVIRSAIAQCLDDFVDYNARIKHKDGFLLKNPASSRSFPISADKKAIFSKAIKAKPESAHDLMLTTIRSHDQFNTAIYGENDRYRGIKGQRKVVFMNSDDIERLNLEHGSLVDLISTSNKQERRAERYTVIQFDIKSGCAAAYFPEINVLVPLERVALESNTPTSKLIPITVRKHLDLTVAK